MPQVLPVWYGTSLRFWGVICHDVLVGRQRLKRQWVGARLSFSEHHLTPNEIETPMG
jgi:hypothetical protein